MARFEFTGDIESLAEPQKKIVEDALQKQGYKDGKIEVEPVGQKGDNYIAHVKRFIYKTDDGSTFKMIGKVAPTLEEIRMIMNIAVLFNNEIIMYNEVLPKLNDLQNSAGVKDSEKVRFPICYGVVTEAPFEFILLEDLNELGFEMLDRFQPLNHDSIKLAIRDLAIFHSLSYVLKNAEPETFTNVTNKMVNMWSLMGSPTGIQIFASVEDDLKKIMDSDKYRNIITGSMTQIGQRANKLQSYEKNSKFSVVQQGDCSHNNILFRLEDGKAVQGVMIDYQLSRLSNPAADILYLIFNCTTHASRLEHYHEWINYYHESLDDSLANYNLKANRLFPKDQLDADLRRYGKLAVGLAILLCTVLIRDSKDAVDMIGMTGDAEKIIEQSASQFVPSTMDASVVLKLKAKVVDIIDTALEFGLVG